MSDGERLGDGPIEEAYRAKMNAIASALDKFLNGNTTGEDREVGFVLMVFKYGEVTEDSRCNYISNGANRKDVVTLMKEMISRFEEQEKAETTT